MKHFLENFEGYFRNFWGQFVRQLSDNILSSGSHKWYRECKVNNCNWWKSWDHQRQPMQISQYVLRNWYRAPLYCQNLDIEGAWSCFKHRLFVLTERLISFGLFCDLPNMMGREIASFCRFLHVNLNNVFSFSLTWKISHLH